MTDTPARLSIDIWSDIMCPWCLVGWGNLSRALTQLEGEIAADIRWHAFELNPAMPPEGEEATAHIMRKYGRTPAQAEGMNRQMHAAAQAAGVSLAYQGPEPAPPAMLWNTFMAHKLLVWAGEMFGGERQTALKVALLRAHWNARRAIGDREVLIDVAAEAGFARDAATAVLDADDYATKVRAEERAAADRNITGVPAMIVDDRIMISGAQPPEAYVAALRRVVQKRYNVTG